MPRLVGPVPVPKSFLGASMTASSWTMRAPVPGPLPTSAGSMPAGCFCVWSVCRTSALLLANICFLWDRTGGLVPTRYPSPVTLGPNKAFLIKLPGTFSVVFFVPPTVFTRGLRHCAFHWANGMTPITTGCGLLTLITIFRGLWSTPVTTAGLHHTLSTLTRIQTCAWSARLHSVKPLLRNSLPV